MKASSHTLIVGRCVALGSLVVASACSTLEPPVELPPLSAAEDNFPKLHEVPARPVPAQSLSDRFEIAEDLVAHRMAQEGEAADIRVRLDGGRERPSGDTGGPSPDTLADLPGSTPPRERVQFENVSAAYVAALIALEKDRDGVDDMLNELVLSQESFVNSNTHNRRLQIVDEQADAEIGRSVNFRSMAQIVRAIEEFDRRQALAEEPEALPDPGALDPAGTDPSS